MNPVTKFMAVALVAIALLIIGALMDGPGELQAAQDVADDAAYAAALADGGASKCAALGRTPVWTGEGHLVCRLPQRPTVMAQGGRP
ncbi:hypothetical protein [Polaromonas sp. CG_23.6]|uniref:hypothetical protein n=1 Tax=Polaromonas sp. CG_23.6 TaxID=2760709 RepID=UPI0024736CDA|nr:hypothetical protein [Polaromonas sp. CG_23.6]MDH6185510.1 hypothetical protein [Polaromonas sp. CG_23.6]